MYREICLYDLMQTKTTKNKKKCSSKFQHPSRVSNYNPNDEAPARTAVFGTNELLYMILSNTSEYEIGTFRLVCKTWNTVASDVDSIEFCLSPVRVHTEIAHPYPGYSEHKPISFNPAVDVSQEYRRLDCGNVVCHMVFSVNCDFISYDLRRLGCQLLSRPSITQVALTVDSPAVRGGESRETSLLTVDGGIRLWHLAEGLRKLRQGAGVRPCRKECKGHSVSAHLICDMLCPLDDSEKKNLEIFEWMETIE
jgi:hypothetical protein